MNNQFSLEQIAKTDDLNADLIMRQYKLDKMVKFMDIKSLNQKLKQSEIAKEVAISTSTLQRYRKKMNNFSPYKTPPSSSNTNTRKQKTSKHTEHELKATSNDLKKTSNDLKMTSKKEIGNKVKSEKILRGGYPNDDNPIKGRDFIEQTFSSQKWPSLKKLQTIEKYNKKSCSTQSRIGQNALIQNKIFEQAINMMAILLKIWI